MSRVRNIDAMKRNSLLMIFLSFTLVLAACKTKNINKEDTKTESKSGVYERLSIDQKAKVDFWKADVLGCNKMRDAENASEIASLLNELKASQSETETLLGKPEDNRPSGPYQVYAYFFDGECDGKQLKEGSVYCLLQLYFDSKSGVLHTATVVCG